MLGEGGGSRAEGTPRGAGRRWEGSAWWAALSCPRESHRAVSWCGQEGPAYHPGGCMVAGSQLGGTLQELEGEGAQGHRFYPHAEVPLLMELVKWTWDLIYSDEPCIRKLIPLSLPSWGSASIIWWWEERGVWRCPAPSPQSPPPRGSRAGCRGEQGQGGLLSFTPESPHHLPTTSAKH